MVGALCLFVSRSAIGFHMMDSEGQLAGGASSAWLRREGGLVRDPRLLLRSASVVGLFLPAFDLVLRRLALVQPNRFRAGRLSQGLEPRRRDHDAEFSCE